MKIIKLRDAFDFIGGGTPSKKDPTFWNGGINWASVKDIKGTYLDSTEDNISQKGFSNSAANIAKPGELILVTRISPGKSILTNIETSINQDLKIVRPKIPLSMKYASYFFKASENHIVKKASGTTVLGITLNILNEIEFPLIPLEEQNKLVNKIEELFSELDKGIEELKTAQQQLKVYRQTVLKWAFEGKLTKVWRKNNPSIETACSFLKKVAESRSKIFKQTGKKLDKNHDFAFSKSKEIDSWATATLNKLIYIAGRIGWRGLTKDEYTREGPLFLSVHALNYGKYVEFKDAFHISKERYLESPEIMLAEKDILLCKDGAGIGKIGIVNGLPSDATVNSSLLVIRGLEIFIPEFLFYLFSGPALQLIVRERITGSATPHLFQNDIRKFRLQIPPKEEQRQIVQEIESRLSVCDKIEETITNSLKQARALRQSILKKAFEGKLIDNE